MRTFALSILMTIALGASASAVTTSAMGAVVEQKTPVVVEAASDEEVTPAPTEESETIYFDAVELNVEDVEVDSEGDIDSL